MEVVVAEHGAEVSGVVELLLRAVREPACEAPRAPLGLVRPHEEVRRHVLQCFFVGRADGTENFLARVRVEALSPLFALPDLRESRTKSSLAQGKAPFASRRGILSTRHRLVDCVLRII